MKKDNPFALGEPLMVQNARAMHPGYKWWVEILIGLLVAFIGFSAEAVILMIPLMIGMTETDTYQQMLSDVEMGTYDYDLYVEDAYAIYAELPVWTYIVILFSTAALIVTVLVYCTQFERRKLHTLGLTKHKSFSEYGIGLVVGLVMFTLTYGLMLLFGGITIDGVTWSADMILTLLLLFLGYVVQGASEEILFRGYFTVSMARKTPLWVSVIVSSLFFAAAHLTNGGVTVVAFINLFLFGVFLCVYTIRRGNLWGACAIHSMWNFAQGNIFGCVVSGTNAGDSIIQTSQVADAVLWNGEDFGPEASLCVTFVLIVAIVIMLVCTENKDAGQTRWEKEPEIVG